MKVRSGFVSNSSSSSFIITWEDKIGHDSVLASVRSLMGLRKTEHEDTNNYASNKAKAISERTVEIREGVYGSIFNVVMLNYDIDFGDVAAYLALSLMTENSRYGNKRFEILDTSIIDD